MTKKVFLIIAALLGVILYSCSKKIHPSKTATVIPGKNNTSSNPKITSPVVIPEKKEKTDSVVNAIPEEKPKPEPKNEFPKVIRVNDAAASKSVDGRLFYDVMGHRYWKNFKDGKYYLFDKSMYNDPDFSPPKK